MNRIIEIFLWAWGIIKTVTNSGANGVITVELKSEIANIKSHLNL